MRRAFTYTSGLIAVLLYLFVLLAIILSFKNSESISEQPKKKEEKIITIDMSKIESLDDKVIDNMPSPLLAKNKLEHKTKARDTKSNSSKEITANEEKVENSELTPAKEEIAPNENKIATPKNIPKLLEAKESLPAKQIRDEKVETKKIEQKTKDIKDLFAGVKTKDIKSDEKQLSSKPTQVTTNKNSNNSLDITEANGKGKKKEDGVPLEYINGIKKRLNSWPASQQFYGEVATVHYTVKTSGAFTFSVDAKNEAFREELIKYLTKLQVRGFDSHGGDRPWSFKTNFKPGD